MTERTARVHLEPRTGTVEVNGTDLSHTVQAVTITGQAGHIPTMTLDLVMHEVDVDGEMHVQVPEATAHALAILGWTPPDDSQPITPQRHDLVAAALRHMARANPDQLTAILRREARIQGKPMPDLHQR